MQPCVLRAMPWWLAVTITGLTGCGGRSIDAPSTSAPTVNAALVDSGFAEARRRTDMTSLVLVHEGTIDRQEYFNGGGAHTAQDVRSVTKSVVSLLVGIALERGCLRSLDQTLAELMGPLAPADAMKRGITLRQLLTMTSGLGGDELANVSLYNEWAAAPDQLTYVWDLPMFAAPGTRFAYYSPNYYIISRILTRNCGQSTSDFARDVLFTPLGIGARSWETDDQGYYNGGAGLTLTPLDMVSLGTLVLSGGRAGTVQVVPAAWMQSATSSLVSTTAMPNVSGYGYGWWVGQDSGTPYVMATGYGGQFIVVVPSKALVVTAASRVPAGNAAAANAQWSATQEIILRHLVRAYK